MRKYICGIDENGFGPILGPLIVTGILTTENIKIPVYIKDSKIFYKNKNDFKKLEEIAIVIFYLIENKLPFSPYQIFQKFTYNNCSFKENICEKNIPSRFENKNLDDIKNKYKDILKEKDKIRRVIVKHICPHFFNEFVSKRESKFLLNLLNFFEIIKETENYKYIKFFCGKIGSTIYYKDYLKHFFLDYQIKTVREDDELSQYILSKNDIFFELGFYKDVENVSPVACLSSIIGKYIREIIMISVRKSLNIEENISGYRDKKTKKIIEKIDFSKYRKNCIVRIS
ncbi:MAG: hypothetical protein NC827_07900 [Candidatus Omnitrophica bacterium]|nr:hypothetical protein [Candidatus Omnitrophota bacterium]MCM8803211.1 hypothetical protein [Candidatus Omnitrophota bacterium]